MFELRVMEPGTVRLAGRLDAAEADRALVGLQSLEGPLTADCTGLEYISSAGLSVLVLTHKRLMTSGHRLRIVNLQPRVRNVFKYAGLDRLFQVD